jgi:hypothetical protein
LPERVQVPLIRHARASAAAGSSCRSPMTTRRPEIVAKALLLARDHEIKDPTILEQLRS